MPLANLMKVRHCGESVPGQGSAESEDGLWTELPLGSTMRLDMPLASLTQCDRLECSFGYGCAMIRWTPDARRLNRSDKQAVSAVFRVSLGPSFPSVPFRIMLIPKVVKSYGRGNGSFMNSYGRGQIHLKCEVDLHDAPLVKVNVGTGCQTSEPQLHRFSETAVTNISRQFDFSSSIDRESNTFGVFVELTSAGVGPELPLQ